MATAKKKEGKKLEKVSALGNPLDEVEQKIKGVISDELMTSWKVSDGMINAILDSTMAVLKDKEIANKVPLFSIVSTMMLFKKAINLKEFLPDTKQDDIYLNAADAEEPPSAGWDTHGKERVLNRPDLVDKF